MEERRRLMNRTLPTPWKPTKAQLLAARNKFVPDLVAKNLIVLFAGINPGLYTAAIGRHFGRPGNRSGRRSPAAASPRDSSHPLKNPCFSTSNSASPTSSARHRRAMNSPTTNFRRRPTAASQSHTLATDCRRFRRHRPLPHCLRDQRRPRRPSRRPLRRQPRLGPPQSQRPQRALPACHPRTTLWRASPLGHCPARAPPD